jgi:hypothetical protein
MIKNILIICCCLLCQACGLPDLITPREVLRTNLRLDGYYTHKFIDKVSGIYKSNARFLYKNGVVINTFSEKTWSDTGFQKYLKGEFSEYFYKSKKNSSTWGVVSISGSDITIEYWPASLGSKSERTLLEKGTIKNDSTFEISGLYDREGKRIEVFKHIYEFKKFSPKPDSTNNFIK